jgi:hypothetical protein
VISSFSAGNGVALLAKRYSEAKNQQHDIFRKIDQCEDTGKGGRIFCFSDDDIEFLCSIHVIATNVLKQNKCFSDETLLYLIVTFYTNFQANMLNFMYNQIK